jgi:hypothetical protein
LRDVKEMNMSRSLVAFAAALLLGGCPSPLVVDVPGVSNSCTLNSQCDVPDDAGVVNFVCSAGGCVQGECTQDLQAACLAGTVPESEEAFCCKPWQLCSEFFECAPNPDSVIGSECNDDDQCPEIGQFCSGGNCFSPQGREACTASHQCGAGERCDLPHQTCVPDNGGCNFCGEDFPELCCDTANGELCDAETGFCIPPGDQECTEDEDCRAGKHCDDLGRGVQCSSDDDCGTGTACNAATGNCYPVGTFCNNDEDCSGFPGRRCATATNECKIPLCEDDDGCPDDRQTCDTSTFTCVLPPANCSELDPEDPPNDTPDNATAMSGTTLSAKLCRGNTDVVSFAVTGGKRYRAKVRFADFNKQSGIVIAMLDENRAVQSSATMTVEQEVTVSAITPDDATGTYYIRLVGNGQLADTWGYTITLEETPAPAQADCPSETTNGIEPNDAVADAHTVTVGPPATLFGRCGLNDVDYYRIDVPPLVGIRVNVEFDDSEGDLTVRLLDAATPATVLDSSDSSGDIETVEVGEGPTALLVEVKLRAGATGSLVEQSYTLVVETVPRPVACDADVGEPDGTIADAKELTIGALGDTTTKNVIRCIAADADLHKITMPQGRGGTLGISFQHSQGDLRLDLLDAAGAPLTGYASNASSPTNGTESIELPQSATADVVYFARVRLHTGAGTTAQPYTISISTYDAGACLASEPATDDEFTQGRCVGTFDTDLACNGATLAAPLTGPSLATCEATPSTAGCGTTCGATDQDTYRVGEINNGQLLYARLEHDPADGALGLTIVRRTAQGQIVEVTSASAADGGVVEASIIAPTVDPLFAREHAVVVRPLGSAGYAAQPYSITVDLGPECTADANEPDETPAEAALLRPDATSTAAYDEVLARSLCGNDTDVYEILAFAGETVTAELDGPAGLVVEIGARPADLSDPATMLDAAASGDAPASVANATNRQLYFTVKRTIDAAAGDYTLTLHAD